MRSVQISEAPFIFHADGYDGNDYTLCGDALEGEDGNAEAKLSNRRINCQKCIAIIEACRRYKKSDIAKAPSHD